VNKKKAQAHYSSNTAEWETPPYIFDALNREFYFTLDPCCSDENAKVTKHFVAADDGLSQSWENEIVFMNPPYGREMAAWMSKAYTESRAGAVVVCLIPARTDNLVWRNYIYGKAEVRFLKKRVVFVGAPNPAPFPSAIVIYRKQRPNTIVCINGRVRRSRVKVSKLK